MARLRFAWLAAGVSAPLALAGLALSGYYYTALQLHGRLLVTVWLLLALFLAHSLLLRWLSITRRRMEWESALQRRQGRTSGVVDADGASVEISGTEPDIAVIDEQTRHLLRTFIGICLLGGLWVVWSAS